MRNVAITVLIIITSVFAGCGGSDSASSGFHDMTKLGTSLKAQGLTAIADAGITDFTLASVVCVEESKTAATCHASYSDGGATVNEVTISEDGKTYISHAAQ